MLHPSSWAERDERDHAAENFFQGGSPKTGYPTSPPGPSSLPEIVSDQISGDGAWMKIRNQKVPLPGGLSAANKMRLASRARVALVPRTESLLPALSRNALLTNRPLLFGKPTRPRGRIRYRRRILLWFKFAQDRFHRALE